MGAMGAAGAMRVMGGTARHVASESCRPESSAHVTSLKLMPDNIYIQCLSFIFKGSTEDKAGKELERTLLPDVKKDSRVKLAPLKQALSKSSLFSFKTLATSKCY